jgi:hypothetical protein
MRKWQDKLIFLMYILLQTKDVFFFQLHNSELSSPLSDYDPVMGLL